MTRDFARYGLLAVILSSLLGCEGSSGPAVEYVEGVVTLDGKPIEGVTVGFSPAKPGSGVPAVGTTDANGVFHLTTTSAGSKPGGGTEVGEYQVTFSKVKTSGGLSADVKPGDPGYGEFGNTREPSKTEYLVPEKYGNPATSGITASVAKGTNKGDKFKFDLTSK